MNRTQIVMGAGAALSAVSLGAALLLAPPALGGGFPDANVKVTPDPSQTGEEITIEPNTAGDDCAEGNDGGLTVDWTISDSGSAVVDSGTVDVQAITGHWQVITSAPGVAGTYAFEADCGGGDIVIEPVAAEPAGLIIPLKHYVGELTVEGATLPDELSASLDRSAGRAGDDIELTAAGCAGDVGAAAFLDVGEPPASPSDIGDDTLQQYDVLEGQFGGVVPVLATVVPGTYQVVVWCMAGQRVLDRVVLGYTVLAPEAEVPTPVPANPQFTG